MTQKQVEVALEYHNKLKRKTISEEKKDKVKRQLFTDERPLSPGPVQHSNTPLSYDISSDGSQTIFFIGYKFPSDTDYSCQECFVGNISAITTVESEIYLHSNCTYGEKNLIEFHNLGFSENDPVNYCKICKAPLFIIRAYHSSHLDFA